LRNRGRTEESTVQLEFLQSVHDKHEEWLIENEAFGTPVLVINAEQPKDIISKICSDIEEDLKKARKKLSFKLNYVLLFLYFEPVFTLLLYIYRSHLVHTGRKCNTNLHLIYQRGMFTAKEIHGATVTDFTFQLH
jgi:hypothetical protein